MNFEYVPLTFIQEKTEIKKIIRNTLIFIYLFEKYDHSDRLENLIESTQYGYNASSMPSGKNKFLRISDIQENKVNWESVPYCDCVDEESYLLKDDDILIARTGGTTGKSFKIKSPPSKSIYAGYLIRLRANQITNPEYIYLFLNSYVYWSQIIDLNDRNFRPKANAENLKSLIIPNCSKKIQDDIVKISEGKTLEDYEDLIKKINNVISYYDKTQEVIGLIHDQFNNVNNLKQAILQEMMRGALVKQNSSYGSGSELLKQIQSNKNNTTSSSNFKNEKLLPLIKEEEIPYHIPNNWIWCRLGDIVDEILGGFAFESNRYSKIETQNQIIRLGNVKPNKLVKETNPVFIDDEYSNEASKVKLREGDILITMTGTRAKRDYLFTLCLNENDISEKNLYLNQRVGCIRLSPLIYNKYLNWVLKDFKLIEPVYFSSTGAANQANIGINELKKILIPLPPLKIQYIIVDKLENLMLYCEELNSKLNQSNKEVGKLLHSVLSYTFNKK